MGHSLAYEVELVQGDLRRLDADVRGEGGSQDVIREAVLLGHVDVREWEATLAVRGSFLAI